MANKRDEITERQEEVLNHIIRHVEAYGYQPTQLEMSEEFGVSIPAVRDILAQLENKGYIRQPGGRTERAIALVGIKFKAVEGDIPDLTLT